MEFARHKRQMHEPFLASADRLGLFAGAHGTYRNEIYFYRLIGNFAVYDIFSDG